MIKHAARLLTIALASAAGYGCTTAFTLEDTKRLQYDAATGDRVEKPFSIIHMRERWPVGVPLHIGVSTPENFTDRDRWRRITVSPRIPSGSEVNVSQHPYSILINVLPLPWGHGMQSVGFLPQGATEVEFGISAEEQVAGIWIPLQRTTLLRPVTQVPTIDDVVHPDTTAELARLISHHLALEFDDARTELGWVFPPKAVWYELRNMPSPPVQHDRDAVAGLSIALRIRFLEHGAEVAVARFFIASASSFTGAPVEGDLDRLREGLANPEGWTVVIESDPEMALLDIENDRYWSGRFERPLSTVAIRPKPQPR